MDKENFVEWGNSPFSKRAIEAALRGHLNNSGPLLNSLERIHAVSRGLEQIFKIAQANRIQELAWRDKDEDDTETQPPLAGSTVEGLLALGEVVARMIAADVDDISRWADKHGVREVQE